MPRPIDAPGRDRRSFNERDFERHRDHSRHSTPGGYQKVNYREVYGKSNGDYRKHNGKHHDEHRRSFNEKDKERKHKDKEIRKNVEPLIVDEMADIIEKKIKKEDFIIFVSETGSGKSTKIPQIVIDRVFKGDDRASVVVTQPRRVAALNLARRVAYERRCKVGEEVGYKFRFEDETSKETKIKYVTDGILLKELVYDRQLKDYKCIIIDEVHERSVDTDILLLQLKKLAAEKRHKIILMSAYTDVEALKAYFDGVEAYYIPGRSFDIETFFIPDPVDDYLDLSLRTVHQLHQTEPTSSAFLVFLTGQEEIQTVVKTLRNALQDADVFAFYAALGHDRPKLFEISKDRRKIVVATNIAETSITIPDVKVVVDSGKVKQKWTTNSLRMDQLIINNISKAQAIQRAGRAGRTGPGKCYRLYTQDQYDKFTDQTVPEIERCNLSEVALMLLDMRHPKLSKVDLLNNPPTKAWEDALFELYALGLIQIFEGVNKIDKGAFYSMDMNEKLEQKYTLTAQGNSVRPIPVTPQLAHFILQCSHFDMAQSGISIAAVCSTGEEMFFMIRDDMEEAKRSAIQSEREKLLKGSTSDFIALLKLARQHRKEVESVWRKVEKENMLNPRFFKEITKIRRQIAVQCEKKSICNTKKDKELGSDFDRCFDKAIVDSFFFNTCIQSRDKDNTYYLLLDPSVKVKIHPSSVLARKFPKMFVFHELVKTNENYAKMIHPINAELLVDKLKTAEIPGLLERIKGG
ncbi:unnamed protein product [Bursaphelenchus okinawaensis]|uniref:RNA helicase n=1 Tax=Bursaphelenchus okinawaensis TaxID=465554 RepID=A0A811LA86_9BILA|nr:unnamed protein product [Bursaphelenchus okinawaensis]CAG9121947.1 unnamed protein product [Bursaphelenchus okinawaensis]